MSSLFLFFLVKNRNGRLWLSESIVGEWRDGLSIDRDVGFGARIAEDGDVVRRRSLNFGGARRVHRREITMNALASQPSGMDW